MDERVSRGVGGERRAEGKSHQEIRPEPGGREIEYEKKTGITAAKNAKGAEKNFKIRITEFELFPTPRPPCLRAEISESFESYLMKPKFLLQIMVASVALLILVSPAFVSAQDVKKP